MAAARIALLSYGAGNIHSVLHAFKRLGQSLRLVSDIKQMEQYNPDVIIMPGVGNGTYMMQSLNERGFIGYLQEWAAESRPLLGICVGAQVLLEKTEEGGSECLGIIPGLCRRFTMSNQMPNKDLNQTPSNDLNQAPNNDLNQTSNNLSDSPKLQIPHMGWNTIEPNNKIEFAQKLCSASKCHYYFVHSYYLDTELAYTIASTDYGIRFSSVIGIHNTVGTQFHPEKSGEAGLIFLSRFLTQVCNIH